MDVCHNGDLTLPPCSVVQEKSKKVYRVGLALLVLSIVLISIFVVLWIANTTDQNGNSAFKKFVKSKNKGRISESTTFTMDQLWFSPNKKFALCLLPDVHILNFSENTEKIASWKLGFNADLLGKNVTLRFDSEQGSLELKTGQNLIVWNSRSQMIKKSLFPTRKNSKMNNDYFQGLKFHLELTDDGILQIIGIATWQADQDKQIIWQSGQKIQEDLNTAGYRVIPSQHIFPCEKPLHSPKDMYHLLFNDVIGVLQLWSSTTSQTIWNSSKQIAGEGPWVCVTSGTGVLVILDRNRQTIWSSTFLKNDLTSITHQTENSTPILRLSDEGEVQLCESITSQPYWRSSDLEPPTWYFETKNRSDGKPNEQEDKASVPNNLISYYETIGYKRVMDRLCLVGNDFLVSHQKLCSRTDSSCLQLKPIPSSPFEISSYIRLDNTKSAVYFILLLRPISIFTPDLSILNPDLIVSYKILFNESFVVKDTDRPLLLCIKQNLLCLTTFSGQLIAKKSISLLSEHVQMK